MTRLTERYAIKNSFLTNENIIGRSRSFIEYIYPDLVELFTFPVGDYSPEEVYSAVNKVKAAYTRNRQ